MASNHEEILLALLSMGFEYEKCSKVIESGVTTLDEAIQRLVNQSSQPPSTTSKPLSKTEEKSNEGSTETNKKVVSRYERQRKDQAEFEKKESRNNELAKKKQKLEDQQAKLNLLKEIESDRKHTKGKSNKPCETKTTEKESYEKQQRENEWKRVQAEKRKERQRVLQAVEADKLRRKEQSTYKQQLKESPETSIAMKSLQEVRSKPCRIQVVFPTKTCAFVFQPDQKLGDLFESCMNELDVVRRQLEYSFLQTFPKKTFTKVQSDITLRELKLYPSAKLILQTQSQQQQSNTGQQGQLPSSHTNILNQTAVGSTDNETRKRDSTNNPLNLKRVDNISNEVTLDVNKDSESRILMRETLSDREPNIESKNEMANQTQENEENIHPSSSKIPNKIHDAFALNNSNPDSLSSQDMSSLSNEYFQPSSSQQDFKNILNNFTTELENSKDDKCRTTNNDARKNENQHRLIHSRLLQGVFANDVQDDVESELSKEEAESRRQENADIFRMAVEQRMMAGLTTRGNTTSSSGRKIPSLQKILSTYVANQLLKDDQQIVDVVSLLNPKVACMIVEILKKMEKLTPNILKKLKPCKLQEIKLDMCRLTTLDVVMALKEHHFLRRISLKAVTCITDRAIETILKNSPDVTYFNLSECEDLTGSFLISKFGLSKLKTLILDKAKVKNDYVKVYLRNCPSKSLVELSLNFCPITNEAFDLIDEIGSLRVLSINNTEVTSLSFLQYLPCLVGLGVRCLNIQDEEMSHVGRLCSLSSLELHGTKISYNGLKFLEGKELKHFTLPDRLYIDNDCISVIQGFQLKTLDLSDHIKLNDECMIHLSAMKTLQTLSMSNTKITDEGALMIKDLKYLETLDFSRTNLSHAISPLFKDLEHLQRLNLSHTNVSDELLPCLNSCTNLTMINLSYTKITDGGVKLLRLQKLSTLIVDCTDITMAGVRRLEQGCPSLKMVRNSEKNIHHSREIAL